MKSLEQLLAGHPDWRAPVTAVLAAVNPNEPGHSTPVETVARKSNQPIGRVFAYLAVLETAGIGRQRLRVIAEDGLPLATFDTIPDIPAYVEDEFGQRHEVRPQDVQLVFEVAGQPA